MTRWRIALLLPLLLLPHCSDSAVSIRVVFPDAQALQQTQRIEILAVADPDRSRCAEILGKRPAQVTGVVAQAAINLPAADRDLVLPDLPMQTLAVAAVTLDASEQVAHAGCATVEAQPGDKIDAVIRLVPCPGGNCAGCTATDECPEGLDCDGGVCRCLEGGRCDGCCANNACYPGTAASHCGVNGAACEVCSTDPCVVGTCTSGSCQLTNRQDGTPCPEGVCHGGACCTGCWDGSTCRAGTTPALCGTGGTICKDCSSVTPCKKGKCVAGGCVAGSDLPDGSQCPNGTCRDGSCCTGCWDGSTCATGTDLFSCGTGGAECAPCTPPGLGECQTATCATGTCETKNNDNGTTCTNGKCYLGTCCTGCWDASSTVCRPGNTDDYCGTDGGPCQDCTQLTGKTCQASGVCG